MIRNIYFLSSFVDHYLWYFKNSVFIRGLFAFIYFNMHQMFMEWILVLRSLGNTTLNKTDVVNIRGELTVCFGAGVINMRLIYSL